MTATFQIDKTAWAKVEKTFRDMVDGVQSPWIPLRESARIVQDDAQRNFDSEGRFYGRGWKALKPSTIRDRIRKGFGAGPILNRTGNLRNNALIRRTGRSSVEVWNITPYAKYHQYGTKNIPIRTVLTVPDETQDAIVMTFVDYIIGLIRKI
jgi:phage gpG-like protein